MKKKKHWNSISIKWKIIIPISIITVGALAVFVTVSLLNTNQVNNQITDYLKNNNSYVSQLGNKTSNSATNDVKQIEDQVNNSFNVFLQNVESELTIVATSNEAKKLADEPSLPRGNVDTKYARLPFKNKSALNSSLSAYLDQITNNLKEIQLAYFATPEGGIYFSPIPDADLTTFDASQRPWYKLAMQNPGKEVWTDPYIDAITKKPIVTVVRTVDVNGQTVGVLGFDVSLDALTNMVTKVKVGEKGYAILTDKNGVILADPDPKSADLIGQNIKDKLPSLNPAFAKDNGSFEYKENKVDKIVYFVTNPVTKWKIITITDKSDLLSSQSTLATIGEANQKMKSNIQSNASMEIISFILLTILVLLAGSLVALYLAKSLMKRISNLKKAMEKLSKGDLTEMLDIEDGDELDELCIRFNESVKQLNMVISKNVNLTREIEKSAGNLASISEETTAQAAEIQYAINKISNSSEKQREEIEEANAVVNNFANSIELVTKNAMNVHKTIEETKKISEDGTIAVSELEKTSQNNLEIAKTVSKDVEALNEQTQRISSFASTIKEIANQTNLLALNAAIEAARAGEQGKGFAVVAQEVRKLAEESAKAVGEVQEIINIIQHQTGISVKNISQTEGIAELQHKMVQKTKYAFEKIEQAIKHIGSEMESTKGTMQEMNESTRSFVTTIEKISNVSNETLKETKQAVNTTKEQTSAIDEVAIAAQNLTHMADSLNKESANFKIKKQGN